MACILFLMRQHSNHEASSSRLLPRGLYNTPIKSQFFTERSCFSEALSADRGSSAVVYAAERQSVCAYDTARRVPFSTRREARCCEGRPAEPWVRCPGRKPAVGRALCGSDLPFIWSHALRVLVVLPVHHPRSKSGICVGLAFQDVLGHVLV